MTTLGVTSKPLPQVQDLFLLVGLIRYSSWMRALVKLESFPTKSVVITTTGTHEITLATTGNLTRSLNESVLTTGLHLQRSLAVSSSSLVSLPYDVHVVKPVTHSLFLY